ncbi:cell division protein FtsB [Arthrobacter pascens]|uniref:FtsB family cell division protein n=1 Tax=Arthrobacter pascens TaxID=1677 RepID=UPI00278D3A3A|nr:septum formation initiator family protein [Arthrobacter pascens]MDQ0679527.1 cell division protein FtsB [Arthrobacter pascens]
MATRRPKVPRAASRHPAKTDPSKETADNADVILADFGGSKEKTAKDKAVRERAASGRSAIPKGTASGTRDGLTRDNTKAGSGGAAGAARTEGRSTGSEAEDEAQPVPAKAFSGRMLALAVVMIAITIMLAPTVKIFFDKRAEIAALNADIAASQAEQDSLRQQVSRWKDPNYVKQQARDRINMVMPGETGYWVFGSDLPAGTSSSQTGTAAQDPADLPWVDSLWESIRRAATD